MCKMMISPGIFVMFYKGQKMAQNDEKFVFLRISGTVPHMIVVSGTHV